MSFTALEYRYYNPASFNNTCAWSDGTTDVLGLLYDGSLIDTATGYTSNTTLGAGMFAMVDLGPTPPVVNGVAFGGVFVGVNVQNIAVTFAGSNTGLVGDWSTVAVILNSTTINGTINRTVNLSMASYGATYRYYRVTVFVNTGQTGFTAKITDFRLYDATGTQIAGPTVPSVPSIPLHLAAVAQDGAVVLTWDASTE